MKSKAYIFVFSATLLLSALLLFMIQPMFSKMILPLLGGTPQVWTTAMLFFQILLLAGYTYAHITTKLMNVKVQALFHLILLIIFFLLLPIQIPQGWTPPLDEDPTLWQLILMTVVVGGPFFVLSGSAPMLQNWFAKTDHKDANNPYFLYAASNLGSMIALFCYPFFVERFLELGKQAESWKLGYLGLIVLTILCAVVVWEFGQEIKTIKRFNTEKEKITWAQRGKWLLLAFIPSSLMLGVTTYITTDIASVPLLWIIPLAIYIGTFIIVFVRKPVISEQSAIGFLGFMAIFVVTNNLINGQKDFVTIFMHLILFFAAALVCHWALSSSRPSVENMTQFYLILSFGGALGGVFNALIAPKIFVLPLEYGLVMGLALCMRYINKEHAKSHQSHRLYMIVVPVALIALGMATFVENTYSKYALIAVGVLCLTIALEKRWMFGLSAALALLVSTPGHGLDHFYKYNVRHRSRNFFGFLSILDQGNNIRVLLHGTTNHGTQALAKEYEFMPLSYYSETSPISDLFEAAGQKMGPQKMAVLGLGIGVTACFYKEGRSFDFYEIDPEVVRVAENPEYFTFLSGCGSPYTIITGDARLTLKDTADENYDFILADAYSSDNIPVHLITKEAVELYLRKLKPNGILGFNVSNGYLDIEPVLAQIADNLNIKCYARLSTSGRIEDTDLDYYSTHAVVFALNPEQESFFQGKGWTVAKKRKGVHLWTDNFSNIISVMMPNSMYNRSEELEKDSESLVEN